MGWAAEWKRIHRRLHWQIHWNTGKTIYGFFVETHRRRWLLVWRRILRSTTSDSLFQMEICDCLEQRQQNWLRFRKRGGKWPNNLGCYGRVRLVKTYLRKLVSSSVQIELQLPGRSNTFFIFNKWDRRSHNKNKFTQQKQSISKRERRFSKAKIRIKNQ